MDTEYSAQNGLHYQAAIQDFRQARRKAALERIMAFLKGETVELFSYEEVRKKLKGTGASARRLQEIPVDAIIGSVGRYADFTRSFLPKTDSDETRWARVSAATASPEGVPPVEVYQIGAAYFVLDGNHRVSVARQSGATTIEAYVTKIRTKVPIAPDIKRDELEVKAEYTEFLTQTRLDELRPGADLSMSTPGKYRAIKQHIQDHRYFMGLDQQREIAYEEAVLDWYDHVYVPLIRIIQDRNIQPEFPNYTLTDLYAWIATLRDTEARPSPDRPADYVEEIQAEVSDSPVSQLENVIIQAEYQEFAEDTGIIALRPNADLRVTAPGKYRLLKEHLEVHRYFMGLDQQREIPDEEAVMHWYDTVYRPIKRMIRARGILRDFPERTATDLYLWIAEHQAELEKQLGWKISSERAAADLALRFSPKTDGLLERVSERVLDALIPDELESGPEPGQWRKDYRAAYRENRMFTSILVPLSGDPQGWCALDHAIRFGAPRGSRLYGLHVVDDAAHQESESVLALNAEFEKRCQMAGIAGDFSVAVGKPPLMICERAFWTDLIVLPVEQPPGSQPLEKLKSGFRTILHRCSRPILAVPGASTAMQRALVAYDGSPKADEALFVSAYLSACCDVTLCVLTVIETGRVASENLSLAQQYLRKHQTTATFLEERRSDHGSVGRAILNVAQAQQCDVIVMGGYGRSPMLELVLGSTVDQVLRESQVPMLICR
jgi:nucleotide-binding universal stress UspA family protein